MVQKTSFVKKNRSTLIGLTGLNASGKGAVANLLIKMGYKYFSLSDEIRILAKKRDLKPSRQNLTMLGQELRQKHGPEVLALKVMKKIKKPYCVIDSIRSPYEIKALRTEHNLFLIYVHAPSRLRYERAIIRGRDESAPTYKTFLYNEKKECTDNPNAQQLHLAIGLADHKIINNRDLSTLEKKITRLLKKLAYPHQSK